MITLVCHACRAFVAVPGTPVDYTSVYAAAVSQGWVVLNGKCYCKACGGKK